MRAMIEARQRMAMYYASLAANFSEARINQTWNECNAQCVRLKDNEARKLKSGTRSKMLSMALEMAPHLVDFIKSVTSL